MNKNIITITTFALMFIACGVFAAGPQSGVHEPGTGTTGDTTTQQQQGSSNTETNQNQTQNQGEDTGIQSQQQEQEQNETGNGQGVQSQQQTQTQAQEQLLTNTGTYGIKAQVKVQTKEQLQTSVQAKQQELQEELENVTDATERSILQNQNRVREAVHALLAAEDLVGGIGQQISAIAQEFNNSIDETVQAEEIILKRSFLLKLFWGGDNETAEELQQQIDQNRIRIQEMIQLKDDCQCEEEVRQMLTEQLQSMEQEQDRLQLLVQDQLNRKGFFGWVKGLFSGE